MRQLIAIVTLAVASTLAVAEPQRGHGGRMAQELDLTEEQREQLREIRKSGGGREEMQAVLTPEQQARAQELREQGKDRRAKRMDHLQDQLDLSDDQVSQMRDIVASGGDREDVRAVMTEEQQARFDEMRKQRKGKRHSSE